MNVNLDDNLYDDMPSFMPTANDEYCLNDDIDEILRSTDSHLDATLDLDNFTPFGVNSFDLQFKDLQQQQKHEENPTLNSNLDNLESFDFGGFSSPASSTSTVTKISDQSTPKHYNYINNNNGDIGSVSDHTSSTCSMDGESMNFNSNEFINFLNNSDHDIKIHDDIKIDDDFAQQYDDILMTMNNPPIRNTPSPAGSCSSSGGSSTSGIQSDASSILEHATNNSLNQLRSIKMEADVPVSVKIESDEVMDTISTAPIRVQPLKIIKTHGAIGTSTITTNKTNTISNAIDNARKTMPPPAPTQSTKPKTIFLSSGDFKALMQKVNSTTITTTNNNGKIGNNNNNNNKMINVQMPKIIMKTKNGQILTAHKYGQNKIMKTTTTATVGPVFIKQQNNNSNNNNKTFTTTKVATATITTPNQANIINNATTTISTTATPTAPMVNKGNMNTYKGMVDEKMLKKQQRMIKNRESASLSRKKKKEYVVSLETRINDLEKENYTLKGENKSLRSQLAAFAQTCQCNHGNVSDFILNTLNMSKKVNQHMMTTTNMGTTTTATFTANLNSKNNHHQQHQQQNHNKINHVQAQINNNNNNNNYKNNINNTIISSSYNHVKIAPKPLMAGKCLKQRITGSTTMKKNVAVLFAMAFMVTLNVGHFQNYLNNKMALESDLEILDETNLLSTNSAEGAANLGVGSGRRLLWVQSESEHKQQQQQQQLLQRTKRASDLEVPPLHFLRPTPNHNKNNNNNNNNKSNNNNARERNELLEDMDGFMDVESALPATTSISYNQTENLRLASNLQKWIDGNDFLNLTDAPFDENILNMGFKLPATDDYLLHDLPSSSASAASSLQQQQQQKQSMLAKRKLFVNGGAENKNNNKQLKLENATSTGSGNKVNNNKMEHIDYDEEINKSNNNQKNSLDVFKPKINEEYLRLFRSIKRRDDTFYVLSFNMDHVLLPASMYNKSTRPKMSLMLPAGDPTNNGDIVLMQIDCEVVNTTEVELKKHMIPEKLRPAQKYQAATTSSRTHKENTVDASEYQKLKAQHGKEPQQQNENSNHTREEAGMTRQKPIVRTYYMMGPRTEQAAAALQKKSHNKEEVEPVFKRDQYERSNATLFSRMRDTIKGDFNKN